MRKYRKYVVVAIFKFCNCVFDIVAALPPSINFLSVTGDHSEGEILTASYGYIGGHEGKSLYNWYLHEVLILVGLFLYMTCA